MLSHLPQIIDTPRPEQVRPMDPAATAASEEDCLELMEMILGALGRWAVRGGAATRAFLRGPVAARVAGFACPHVEQLPRRWRRYHACRPAPPPHAPETLSAWVPAWRTRASRTSGEA